MRNVGHNFAPNLIGLLQFADVVKKDDRARVLTVLASNGGCAQLHFAAALPFGC